ncbi:hypothetical protein BaRGS_00008504 [Batillaria attramentaria]|uniref:Uncharacterized protein n=1 Tax=Batillaria attramentaria TaxID=370345 RepID=A0ABD0LM12_9CAEN
METKVKHAAFHDTLRQLTIGVPVEMEITFLESLSACVNTQANDSCVLQNGGNVNGVSIIVTRDSDEHAFQAEGTDVQGTDVQGTDVQQNRTEISSAGLSQGEVLEKCFTSSAAPNARHSDSYNGLHADVQSKQNSHTSASVHTGVNGLQEVDVNRCSTSCATGAQSFHNGHTSSRCSSLLQDHVPVPDLHALCHDPNIAEHFIEYVFTRRYGRADKELVEDEGAVSDARRHPVDARVEEHLNEQLDALINRIVEQPVTAEMAAAFEKLLVRAADMPTLRFKMLEHVVVWLSGVGNIKVDDNIYNSIKVLSIIDTGGCDRRVVGGAETCSNALPKIFRVWSQQQQQDFFSSMLEMCINRERSWQAKDGAALCVSAIMHNCFTAEGDADKQVVKELPSFFVECVLTIVFSLISHPQLSIRETVAKIMSAYMGHVDSQDMVDLLHQTLTLLTPSSGEWQEGEFQCVEAYAAEGLLNICISIFKVLPVKQAVSLWPTYRTTLLTYLTHDASSVRQTSSTVFLHLASKREGSAVLIKVVMHHLTKDWHVDAESLSACADFLQGVSDGMRSWEAREGRMFVYELLCKHLIEQHLEMAQASSKLPATRDEQHLEMAQASAKLPATRDEQHLEMAQASAKLPATRDEQHLEMAQASAKLPATRDEQHLEMAQASAKLPALHDASSKTNSVARDLEKSVCTTVGQHLMGLSSLMQLHLLDHPHRLARAAGVQVWDDAQHQSLQWWLLAHYASLSDSSAEMFFKEEGSLPTFRDLLLAMLHHTAVCLAHSQWELRRIAQQVLPHLCEVMCLYDVELIMTVWQYTTEEATLWSFLGLYALHQSLTHCARVVATADLTDKASSLKDSVYIELVNGVRKHVENYLPLVCSHLRRPVFDKLSVIAAEIAMLAVNVFDLEESVKQDLSQAVLHLWANLFTFAHPASAISTSLFDSPAVGFLSPHEGFLSCCLVRPETKLQCARQDGSGAQVEKSLMAAVNKHLADFLPQLDVHSAAICLPVLAHNIGLFIDDTEICRSLINSFSRLCQCTSLSLSASMNDGDVEDSSVEKSLRCVYFTLRELAAVIAMKKVLNCYVILCRLLNPVVHLPLLLKGICARLNEGHGFHLDTADKLSPDVDLRWHKTESHAESGGDQRRTSDTLDTSLGQDQSETDSLNQSGSSYGARLCPRMGRRRTLSLTGDTLLIHEVANHLGDGDGVAEDSDDSESDWDSWSEEENDEEVTALKGHFQEFFRDMQAVYGSECYRVLDAEKHQLTRKEQDVLMTLVSKS